MKKITKTSAIYFLMGNVQMISEMRRLRWLNGHVWENGRKEKGLKKH